MKKENYIYMIGHRNGWLMISGIEAKDHGFDPAWTPEERESYFDGYAAGWNLGRELPNRQDSELDAQRLRRQK